KYRISLKPTEYVQTAGPYRRGETGRWIGLPSEAERKINNIADLFNQLDIELSRGEKEPSASGLPRSESPTSFVEVRGLSYSMDDVSFEVKQQPPVFIDLNNSQYVFPRSGSE